MKSRFLPLLAALFVTGLISATAQDDTNPEATAPAGSTLITSDELHADQNAHTAVWTNNVVVTGTNFRLTCQELTVFFTKDNKVDHLVATGNVVITQPDRITHCGHAEYFHDEDKFILTDRPIIDDGKTQVGGVKIIIYRQTQKMEVNPDTGGRTRTIIKDQSLGPTPGGATPSPGALPK